MIRFSGVGLAYPGSAHPALTDVDLTFRPGESVAVAGPSGSGKTTLVRLMNALVLPSSGSVTVDGLDTRDAGLVWEIRRRVGLIFQNPDNQFVSTTVEREIAFGMENLGLPRTEIALRIDEVLARLGLEHLKQRPPHRLSGGEKQRVAIAAVLAMRPAYLALDEPTSLLDGQGRREVWGILEDLRRDPSRSVIHVTQFADEVLLASRAIVLSAGRVVFDGTPHELFTGAFELDRFGLRRPAAMDLADRLRRGGYRIPDTAVTLDALVDAVAGKELAR
jgi:energy-coupling factor transport system ATP-binding protein